MPKRKRLRTLVYVNKQYLKAEIAYKLDKIKEDGMKEVITVLDRADITLEFPRVRERGRPILNCILEDMVINFHDADCPLPAPSGTWKVQIICTVTPPGRSKTTTFTLPGIPALTTYQGKGVFASNSCPPTHITLDITVTDSASTAGGSANQTFSYTVDDDEGEVTMCVPIDTPQGSAEMWFTFWVYNMC